MSVNKFKILQNELDHFVNIPVEMTWDFTGRDDAIDEYQNEMLKIVVGDAKDFEVIRFSQKPFPNDDTGIKYEFNFYDFTVPVTNVPPGTWSSTYLNNGFSVQNIYYYTNSFTKSFFKLDFYDTTDEKTQKNYFTVILPVQQGLSQSVQLNPYLPNVDIRIPTFELDFVGDKEGFFLYWLRKRAYIDIDTFYMTAKFFDGKTGNFIRMTNTIQTSITPNLFTFNNDDYFYYKVVLDYNDFTYEVFDTQLNLRVGGVNNPIKWFEYVNP